MSEEIINRVANSKLVTFNLEDFYPKGERILFDISHWLMEGIVLRESEFREKAKEHDWAQYQDKYVSLFCSTDAIVPGWAYLLLSLHLAPFTKKVTVGSLDELESILFAEVLQHMDVSEYTDKSVIIKGCAHKPIPQNAYVLLAQKLQPIAKNIMYGEACSSVPLFKRK
ncbi:Protein of unknown function (DUF2480) [Aequorivita sublithincola DSM 14238]|uniref:DUF2480 family protein n=1 Tax=Aequorivita sublithincola (strain DSM 14238 / LMG 21431 / ACAM 643 / 9-3) TaxID=746697 RepID=I3YVH9_AEQSU|nr:DUF2480 family protein [Aequorivita sublithincola]AFL80997.1 Protein of unknown function (DUF2480) [Aequorivita sublithincola DSM 14238]